MLRFADVARRVLSLVLIVTVAAAWSSEAAAQEAAKPAAAAKRVFKAGAATSNITPPLGLPIVGGFSPKPSHHVHDELHARCLVLDDGQTRLVFVVCDLLGISDRMTIPAKQLIQEATGIPASHIMISATHTHSGSSAVGSDNAADKPFNDYRQLIIRRIADGVVRAIRQLEPAQIAWGVTEEPGQVFNRRWYLKPGSPDLINPFGQVDVVKMNPPSRHLVKPAGPTDPQISFISVRSVEGRPIALLANYGLHYVGGGTAGAISADYFAMFADRIGELLGADRQDPPFVGMMSNGASGDVNNIQRGSTTPSQRFDPWGKMRYVADVCAKRVIEAHKNVTFRDHVSLAAVQRELTLATRKPTAEQVAWAREIRAGKTKPPHALSPNYAGRILGMADGPGEVTIALQAFRIGDLGVTAIPFEVFAEIGLELKRRSPLQPTFTVSLANGSNGYLPTPEQHKLGGYETWLGTNRVEFQASRKMTEQLVEMLSTLGEQRVGAR